jgi:hypothetical protein
MKLQYITAHVPHGSLVLLLIGTWMLRPAGPQILMVRYDGIWMAPSSGKVLDDLGNLDFWAMPCLQYPAALLLPYCWY